MNIDKNYIWVSILAILTLTFGIFYYYYNLPETKLLRGADLNIKELKKIRENINYCEVHKDCRSRLVCCKYSYYNWSKEKIAKALNKYDLKCSCKKIPLPAPPKCVNGKCVEQIK